MTSAIATAMRRHRNLMEDSEVVQDNRTAVRQINLELSNGRWDERCVCRAICRSVRNASDDVAFAHVARDEDLMGHVNSRALHRTGDARIAFVGTAWTAFFLAVMTGAMMLRGRSRIEITRKRHCALQHESNQQEHM